MPIAAEEAAIQAWENEGGATESGPQANPASRAERLRLQTLFQEVDLPEIQGTLSPGMRALEIAKLLPAYGTGGRPMMAILIDRDTGRAYGIASGWEEGIHPHNGMLFRSGALPRETAAEASPHWRRLGFHMEPVAAAFMRKKGITNGAVVINGTNPCYGDSEAPGCDKMLPVFLEEGSQMVVYNKYGNDHTSTNPDHKFRYTGNPD